MKYIKNTPLLGRNGKEVTLTDAEGGDPKPLTPLLLLRTAGLSFPAEKVADWRPVNAMLDSLDEQEEAKILEIKNEWWNTIKDHIDRSLAQVWRSNATAIWDEIEERFESERIKCAEKDKSKGATGPGKKK